MPGREITHEPMTTVTLELPTTLVRQLRRHARRRKVDLSTAIGSLLGLYTGTIMQASDPRLLAPPCTKDALRRRFPTLSIGTCNTLHRAFSNGKRSLSDVGYLILHTPIDDLERIKGIGPSRVDEIIRLQKAERTWVPDHG